MSREGGVSVEQKENTQRKGPLITNAEIAKRARIANKSFRQFDDIKENWLRNYGSLGEEFYFQPELFPDKDESGTVFYQPSSGSLRLKGYFIYGILDGQGFTRWIHNLPNIEERLQVAEKLLEENGIHLAHTVKRDAPKKDYLSHITDSIHVYLGFGSGAAQDQYHKDIVTVELNKLQKITKPEYSGQAKEIEFRNASQNRINIPYSPDMEISTLITQLNVVFAVLQKTGVFPPNPPLILEVRFKSSIEEVNSPVKPPYTKEEFDCVLELLRRNIDGIGDSNNSYLNQFIEDLKRVPYLDFAESVRMTQSLVTNLANNDLIARLEICEIGQTRDGEFTLLLPTTDYLPPNADYRFHVIHSRILETWNESQSDKRVVLLRRLKRTVEFAKVDGRVPVGLGYRAYFIELASGKRLVVADIHPSEKKQVLDSLKENYKISDMESLSADFERIAYNKQVSEGIQRDVSLLMSAGVNKSDVEFYRYWASRFWLTRDADPKAIYEDVALRFEELDKILYRQKVPFFIT